MNSLRIAYAGTPEFAVPALKAILESEHELVAAITQPDRKSGRGRKIQESPVKRSITSENVLLLQPEDINTPEALDSLAKLQLDLIVVAAYGQIFCAELLSMPRLGCINIHASLLPRWRGASPIQHAILAGDENTGVTIMQMAQAMDAGAIWQQAQCEISADDTAESLHDKLAQMGGEIILPAIKRVALNEHNPTAQSSSQVTYCAKLNKSDGLIDWNESAEIIMRKIRAFYPWPGAYTFLNGRRLRITHAVLGSIQNNTLLTGTIFNISKTGFSVATHEGCVEVRQLIPEGGKLVSALDFSHSNDLLHKQLGE